MDKKEIDHIGYDQEEFYFARLNRELIERLKAKLARKDAGAPLTTQEPDPCSSEVARSGGPTENAEHRGASS